MASAKDKLINDQRRDYLESVGIPREDVTEWVKKWHALEMHCVQTGKPLELTFFTYIDLAVEAGILDYKMIGKSLDSYQLGRYGDVGGYSVTNCRFITKRQNLKERNENGCMQRGVEKRKQKDKAWRKIVLLEKDGEQLLFRGINIAAKHTGAMQSNIVEVAKGKRKHAKGYSVSYVSPDDLHKYSHLLIIDE